METFNIQIGNINLSDIIEIVGPKWEVLIIGIIVVFLILGLIYLIPNI